MQTKQLLSVRSDERWVFIEGFVGGSFEADELFPLEPWRNPLIQRIVTLGRSKVFL
ncbi:MAG: hypothetical protein H7A24_06220 [Leptospiraceae bacterium]|nr:hypothetical protein [Leptospiraceae bacterium]